MSSPRKTRSPHEGDQTIGEFTSGQLVIGIVCVLLLAVICFMLGILVGKKDSSLHTADANGQSPAVEAPAMTAQTSGEKAPVPAKAEPVQQSPRVDLPGLKPLDKSAAVEQVAPLPAPKPQEAPAAATPASPEAPTARVRLDETKAPEPAPSAAESKPDSAMPPVPPPAKVVLAEAEPKDSKPAPAPSDKKPDKKPGTPALKPAEPPVKSEDEKGKAETKAEAKAKPAPKIAPVDPPDSPAAAPAKGSTAGAAKGSYAVQLGASKDEAKAKAEQQKLKSQKNIVAEVVRLPGDDYFHIVVTGYADRAAADAAKAELSEKIGAQCIVKKLN